MGRFRTVVEMAAPAAHSCISLLFVDVGDVAAVGTLHNHLKAGGREISNQLQPPMSWVS